MNSRGDGPWSKVESVVVGTPGRPVVGIPTPGDAQITVVWTAPASNGSVIIDYDVQYWVSSSERWILHSDDGNHDPSDSTTLDTDLTRDITGLTNGTSYLIQVRHCHRRI